MSESRRLSRPEALAYLALFEQTERALAQSYDGAIVALKSLEALLLVRRALPEVVTALGEAGMALSREDGDACQDAMDKAELILMKAVQGG